MILAHQPIFEFRQPLLVASHHGKRHSSSITFQIVHAGTTHANYDNNPRNYEQIQLGGDKLNTVTTFKYLGSIFDSNGGAERDINNRAKLAWIKWKQLTGVLCDDKKVDSIHQTERR